jgi:hypothetical protein
LEEESVSRINVHKVQTEERHGDREEIVIPPVHEGTEEFSAREGEELSAAADIIDLLDALDNGEALVITRDIW